MIAKLNKCYVGLSGGVDSSVAAYLLKEQGYDVNGLTAWFWPESKCCSMKMIDGAAELCGFLGIPFQKVDVMNEFVKVVVDNFCSEYLNGRTPNPCTRCNTNIKFRKLWEGIADSFEFFATGHYAKISKENGRYLLKKGKDTGKDQSYMLYGLSQEQLSKSIFPLGDYTKEEARKIAENAKLPTSQNKDSQDVCFVLDGRYPEFVEKFSEKQVEKGHFIDKNKNILGEHKGIVYYTIGQRKGLGISSAEPYYVTGFDVARNEIILGREKDLYGKKLIVSDINWIALSELKGSIKASVKIRYNSQESSAQINPVSENQVEVIFKEEQKAITPGQNAVFYDRDVVIGGGVIKNA